MLLLLDTFAFNLWWWIPNLQPHCGLDRPNWRPQMHNVLKFFYWPLILSSLDLGDVIEWDKNHLSWIHIRKKLLFERSRGPTKEGNDPMHRTWQISKSRIAQNQNHLSWIYVWKTSFLKGHIWTQKRRKLSHLTKETNLKFKDGMKSKSSSWIHIWKKKLLFLKGHMYTMKRKKWSHPSR